MPALRLWSIQRVPAWSRLLHDGVLHGDGRRVYAGFREPYRWMMGQMAKRLAGYGGGFPLWAWHDRKPDLRRSALLPRGTHGICIELSVDSSRVLLSDFGAWHNVLNDHYLALTEAEYRRMDGRCSIAAKRRSWERVFALKAVSRSRWLEGADAVQAVVERIALGDVLSFRHFVAR